MRRLSPRQAASLNALLGPAGGGAQAAAVGPAAGHRPPGPQTPPSPADRPRCPWSAWRPEAQATLSHPNVSSPPGADVSGLQESFQHVTEKMACQWDPGRVSHGTTSQPSPCTPGPGFRPLRSPGQSCWAGVRAGAENGEGRGSRVEGRGDEVPPQPPPGLIRAPGRAAGLDGQCLGVERDRQQLHLKV